MFHIIGHFLRVTEPSYLHKCQIILACSYTTGSIHHKIACYHINRWRENSNFFFSWAPKPLTQIKYAIDGRLKKLHLFFFAAVLCQDVLVLEVSYLPRQGAALFHRTPKRYWRPRDPPLVTPQADKLLQWAHAGQHASASAMIKGPCISRNLSMLSCFTWKKCDQKS